MESDQKICTQCSMSFEVTPDDVAFYKKIDVPSPTRCPECRYIRRLLDRNEYTFYKRKCDATGKDIISIYRSDAPFPVYQQDYWKSDAWDGTSYGREFDFARPFFEQYEELRRVVPHLALVNSNSVASEYTNQSNNNKECYMLVTSDRCEKCMYGAWCQKSFMCSDCYMMEKSEFCFYCVDIANCSNCAWLNDCADCINVFIADACRGCTDCFGCVGLKNKQYYWFNKPLSKKEYEANLKEFPWTREAINDAREQLKVMRSGIPVKYYHGLQAQDSNGDYIENSQRAKMVFNARDNKDTAYMQDAWNKTFNCRDCTEIVEAEYSYEIQGTEIPHRVIVARSCFGTITDSCYCDMCFGVSDCFGCFGLRQAKYCILNKQYSKEDYLALKARIITHMKATEEWGEYFPANVSPFAYNESMAQDYFPLAKEEVLRKGYSWYDRPAANYAVTMEPNELPKTLTETSDSILQETVRCRTQENSEAIAKNPWCATAFRIVPLELDLYKKLGIPVPDYCGACRRVERFDVRNPRRLRKGTCQCTGTQAESGYKNIGAHFHGTLHCPNIFETSYPKNSIETIYCEQCYNAEVM